MLSRFFTASSWAAENVLLKEGVLCGLLYVVAPGNPELLGEVIFGYDPVLNAFC